MAKDLMAKSPIPIHIQYIIIYVGLFITILSGIAMLKGQNWARHLYVIWGLIGFVVGITSSPTKVAMIPSFVVFLLVAFFLFRPNANTFFAPLEAANSE